LAVLKKYGFRSKKPGLHLLMGETHEKQRGKKGRGAMLSSEGHWGLGEGNLRPSSNKGLIN